jgi:hypothetical protein
MTDRGLEDETPATRRNTEGTLTPGEREGLESLVELSETIALVRAQALHVLGRKPM